MLAGRRSGFSALARHSAEAAAIRNELPRHNIRIGGYHAMSPLETRLRLLDEWFNLMGEEVLEPWTKAEVRMLDRLRSRQL